MENSEISENTVTGLIRFNLIMGFFHLIQGIIILILSNQFSLPITTNFLSFNPVSKAVETTTSILLNIRIGPMVAGFLFLSAIAHFIIASPFYKNSYILNI